MSNAQEATYWAEPPAELLEAERLRVAGELDAALKVCVNYMNDHYDDVGSVVMAAHIFVDADKMGLAQALYKLATVMRPESGLIWCNLGMCYQEGSDLVEGERCLLKAIHRNPEDAMAFNNLAQLYYNMGQPLKAINCADKALRLAPDMLDAKYNRGMAMLMLGDWKEGWAGFDEKLGVEQGRKERIYGHIPRWTGVEGCKLIAYGEQGIGDEISFASCIPDLCKQNEVIIECDKRLQFLFRRSFPNCVVHGTRFSNNIKWPVKGVEASVAMGSLPRFYRQKDEDFHGTPYLIADPQRRTMCRALLDSLGDKPKVGILWAGGLRKTGAKKRSLLLYDLMPILRQDATFISLMYKDASEVIDMEENHGVKVHHWSHIVQTADYDDTAALVAELDLVITVQQSVVHLAGALGVPCWVMLPKAPLWRYRLSGEKFLWANSVKLYRQQSEWIHVISDVARDLRNYVAARNEKPT